MSEENISQEFRLKNVGGTRNYFIEEINKSELMSKKHKKFCRVFNYIASSAIGLKICVLTAGIKKYKLIIKKKKHDNIVLLAKSKLNSIEVLISTALIMN